MESEELERDWHWVAFVSVGRGSHSSSCLTVGQGSIVTIRQMKKLGLTFSDMPEMTILIFEELPVSTAW